MFFRIYPSCFPDFVFITFRKLIIAILPRLNLTSCFTYTSITSVSINSGFVTSYLIFSSSRFFCLTGLQPFDSQSSKNRNISTSVVDLDFLICIGSNYLYHNITYKYHLVDIVDSLIDFSLFCHIQIGPFSALEIFRFTKIGFTQFMWLS